MQQLRETDVHALDILLVFRNDGALLPVYRGALGHAEGWPWRVEQLYPGALVVSPSNVSTIVKVEIVGPAGGSALAKCLSVLNSNWKISVALTERRTDFADIVNEVLRGLRNNGAAQRAVFDRPESELTASVERVESIAHLFRVLGIDRPEFVALDSL